MVRRNLPGNWNFTCVTDDPIGIDARIDIIDISNIKVRGWWTEIAIFDPRIPFLHETVLYLDLDTVIVDSLAFLENLNAGFYIFEHPDAPRFNFSVMIFERNLAAKIFNSITPEHIKRLPGDQEWVEECIPNANVFEYGKIALYRGLDPETSLAEVKGKKEISIVTFPANPKLHHLIENWVPEVWK